MATNSGVGFSNDKRGKKVGEESVVDPKSAVSAGKLIIQEMQYDVDLLEHLAEVVNQRDEGKPVGPEYQPFLDELDDVRARAARAVSTIQGNFLRPRPIGRTPLISGTSNGRTPLLAIPEGQ